MLNRATPERRGPQEILARYQRYLEIFKRVLEEEEEEEKMSGGDVRCSDSVIESSY